MYYFSRRRRLYKFFGCQVNKKLLVYLSNIQINLWSAIDIEGRARSYTGPAVPGYEVELVAPAYRAFLAPMPGLDDQKGFLRNLALRDIELRVQPSPHGTEDVDTVGTILSVGSTGYNAASVLAESSGSTPFAKLDPRGGVVLTSSERRFEGPNFALVQKLYNESRRQWIFYVAGSATAGTTGAYFYLLNNWVLLSRTYGLDRPFLCALAVSGTNTAATRVIHSVLGDSAESSAARR